MKDNKSAVDVDIERYERIRPLLSRLVWAGPCPNAETVTTLETVTSLGQPPLPDGV